MLNKNVQKVLKELNNITNSGILRYPETVLVSDAQDVQVKVNLADFDTDGFTDIHLMNNLSEFLALLSMFETPKVELSEKEIKLSEGGKNSTFLFDNPVLMSQFDKDTVQFERTEEVPDVAVFELLTDDFKAINKASGVFKDLEEVIIRGQDGDTAILLGNTSSFNARSNTYSIDKPQTSTKEFEIKIPIQNFKMLPVSDYTFYVKYNEARNAYRIYLSNKDLDLKIIMSVKV